MAKKLPLHRVHAEAGANFDQGPSGLLLPMDYGSLPDEVDLLRNECALVDRSWRSRLELTGSDRERYLQGLVTCDVEETGEGSGSLTFITDAQGKVLADAVVLALDDRLWIELPPGKSREIGDHLRKFIVTDDVEVIPLADMVPISLVGPQAAERLRSLLEVGSLPEQTYDHQRVRILGTELRLVCDGLHGRPGWTLWVSASVAPTFLREMLDVDSISLAGFEAQDRLRIEAGVPRFGVDFGATNLPQETGLETLAVSYEKGCYLGQEIVARLHFRGQASQLMRRFSFDSRDGDLPLQLMLDGREAGAITSAAPGVDEGRSVGLGIVQRRAADPGTALDIPSGGQAVVGALPIAAS